MKPVMAVDVGMAGRRVGELLAVPSRGLVFAYDPEWLSSGFNLSPLNMQFNAAPQSAADARLFNGLHSTFADSLPDGWGMRLVDPFFQRELGVARHAVSPLDRLAYMGDRSMGALECRPARDAPDTGPIDLSGLYQAALDVSEGATGQVLDALRMAGGSPGGARPKVVVALSGDGRRCASPFAPLPEGHAHWLVKFRSKDEPRDAGAIEYAYARMAAAAGVEMAPSILLDVAAADGGERFFATRRFDRDGDRKRHVMTASGILYADHRMPSLDYGDLLRATWAITRHAGEVERMARLMVFNALSHNHDDHAKNFAFLCDDGRWQLAPAYDLTFCRAQGAGGEHTTAFAGAGHPTREALRKVCAPFSFLDVDACIARTLDALSDWDRLCSELGIEQSEAVAIGTALAEIRRRL